MLKLLRVAHFVVPILQFIQEVMQNCGFYTISKCLGIISIFQFQMTIFRAQLFEMRT